MQDIKVTLNNGRFDISFENGDIVAEDGFDTAIYVSLFTDARAPENLVAIPEKRRGWIGNTASPVEGRDLGGLLWLVDQRRLTQKTLNATVDYARKALNWFVDDGLLSRIDVTGVIIPKEGVRLGVTMTALNGKTETRYFDIWKLTGN